METKIQYIVQYYRFPADMWLLSSTSQSLKEAKELMVALSHSSSFKFRIVKRTFTDEVLP